MFVHTSAARSSVCSSLLLEVEPLLWEKRLNFRKLSRFFCLFVCFNYYFLKTILFFLFIMAIFQEGNWENALIRE